ncbi:MAG: hypothetical protein Q8Q38_00765 [bacterium]|nr:hypothetical protein [bacterium]MDZ4231931.1 hypothetical protein [Candidatus Pacearchaeota archaeon]
MKHVVIALSIALLVFPFAAGAHAGDAGDAGTGFGMMRTVEDRALGDELHEEMESLMVKMMAGDMSDEEAGRMIELMDENPGPYGTMMGRMMGMQFAGTSTLGQPLGMMSWGAMGSGGFWPLLLLFAGIVWLVVGILAIVWLSRQINKK